MPDTTPLTYNGYVSNIAALAVYNVHRVPAYDPANPTAPFIITPDDAPVLPTDLPGPFTTVLPQMLNYAELRIQRDLNLWQAQSANGYSLAAGSNLLSIPVDDFVNVQSLAITGAEAPLIPTSKEFIQNVCASTDPSQQGPPIFFAPYGGDWPTGGAISTNFLIGPCPDQAYPITATGFSRMPTLYAQGATAAAAMTATTWISVNLPDLLIAASMIFITGYQRNFGAQASDPQMGQSWETQYENLLKGALTEEAVKRFAAQAWGPMGLTPLATPPRQ